MALLREDIASLRRHVDKRTGDVSGPSMPKKDERGWRDPAQVEAYDNLRDLKAKIDFRSSNLRDAEAESEHKSRLVQKELAMGSIPEPARNDYLARLGPLEARCTRLKELLNDMIVSYREAKNCYEKHDCNLAERSIRAAFQLQLDYTSPYTKSVSADASAGASAGVSGRK